MKRTAFVLLSTGILVVGMAGRAAAFNHFTQNEFTTAESLDTGMTQVGVQFTLADHYKSYYPEIRYGLGALFEVGFKFGATATTIEGSDELGALVGADLKYQLVKEAEGVPVDMAVDLGVDNTILNSKNATDVTFSTIFSKNYPLTDRGYQFVPYGGLELAALYGSLPARQDTAFNVFGGIEWKLSPRFMVLLELKAADSLVGGAGIRFEY